ncbi:alpha/beta fold hydrolase [Synechococcus sp. BSF8S]|nr:alpha/beta fold hydrolase [Synechococcus sp. BSF8S]MBC1264153.1 alpha/beta fold hydrolase [Synechococcus sp. BSA11S]
MRPLATWLHRQGYSVEVPLLAGHGTCLKDLQPVQASDWSEQVVHAIARLRQRGERVVVGGLSLGSILALQAGMQDPDLVGLLLYSPPIAIRDRRRWLAPLLRLLVRELPKDPDDFVDPSAVEEFWGYERYPVATSLQVLHLISQVRSQLRRKGLQLPALVLMSHQDRVVQPAKSVAMLQRCLNPERCRFCWLEGSGHVLTIDGAWQQLAQLSVEALRDWELEQG